MVAIVALLDHSSSILDHLLAHGVLAADALLDDELQIAELNGRNSVVSIRGKTTRLLVKEYRARIAFSESLSEREGAFYRSVLSGPATPIAEMVPRLVHFDLPSGRLVLEEISGGPAHDRLRLEPAAVGAMARTIGAELARVHDIDPEGYIDCVVPLALRLSDEYGVEPKNDAAAAVRTAASDRARQFGWREAVELNLPGALAHADLRLSNLLIDAESHTHFLDWETAGRGSPVLDIGAIIASSIYWDHASASAVGSAGGQAAAAAFCRGLLQGYSERRSLPSERAMAAMACLSLYQFAFEDAQQERAAPSTAEVEMLTGIIPRLLRAGS